MTPPAERRRGTRRRTAAPVQRNHRGRGSRSRDQTRARSTASSVRTAPASRRPCGCCARCWRRPVDDAIVAGYDVAADPGAVRLRIGAALQDVALDPKQTGTELLRLQGLLYGLPKRALDRRVAATRRTDRSRRRARPAHRHVLRRHAAPPRPGRGARAQPRDPVPRRADDRARPDQPRPRVGRGPPAQRRARHDDLPHDAVPRRGRRARATASASSTTAAWSPKARRPT